MLRPGNTPTPITAVPTHVRPPPSPSSRSLLSECAPISIHAPPLVSTCSMAASGGALTLSLQLTIASNPASAAKVSGDPRSTRTAPARPRGRRAPITTSCPRPRSMAVTLLP